MSDPRDPAPPLDEDRRRRIVRIGLAGVALGLLLALGVGLAGGEGRAGIAVWLLVSAASTAIAALYGTATALLDDLRDRPVSGRRVGLVVGAFLLSAALMAMVAGVGG